MTDYYVSNSGSNSNNGTSELTPWETIGKVNSTSFSTSDGVYFNRGDTFDDARLTIDWGGTSGNLAIVGAYGSGNKPIFDGNKNTSGNNCIGSGYRATVEGDNENYVRVENLNVRNNEEGIILDGDYCEVVDNTVTDCCRRAIRIIGQFGLIDGNYTHDTAREYIDSGGGWPSNISLFNSFSHTVRDNICDRTYGEGIIASGSEHIVENNIVYGARALGIYFIESENSVARNNLILGGTTNSAFHRAPGSSSGHGFVFANEDDSPEGVLEIDCYNNLVGSCSGLLRIGGDRAAQVFNNCNVVYNTVVDCDYGLGSASQQTKSGVRIQNNIFQRYTSGLDMWDPGKSENFSGFTFSHNHWTDSVGGDLADATNTSGDALLAKTTGWRSMPNYQSVTSMDFDLEPGSPCIEAGVDLEGEERNPTISDYTEDYDGDPRSLPHSLGGLGVGTNTTLSPSAVSAVGSVVNPTVVISGTGPVDTIDNGDGLYSEIGTGWTDVVAGGSSSILSDWVVGTSHVVPFGTSRAGIVVVSTEESNAVVSSVSWGGQLCTEKFNGTAGTDNLLYIGWVSDAQITAMSGSDIVVTGSNADSVVSAVYQNADQTDPFGSSCNEIDEVADDTIICPGSISIGETEAAFQAAHLRAGPEVTAVTAGFAVDIFDKPVGAGSSVAIATRAASTSATPTPFTTWATDVYDMKVFFSSSIKSSGGSGDMYQGDARQHPGGTGDNKARYTFTIPVPWTQIDFYEWHPTVDGASSATQIEVTGKIAFQQNIDQSTNPGQWNLFKSVNTSDGAPGDIIVDVTDIGNGTILADAFRLLTVPSVTVTLTGVGATGQIGSLTNLVQQEADPGTTIGTSTESGDGQASGAGGYVPGDYWVTDDRTGFSMRSSEMTEEWTGYVVHKDEWEPRHPQDFVRGVKDNISPSGAVRPEDEDTEIEKDYGDPSSTIPDGTFTP